MRISYNWLKDYIDLTESPDEISRLLTHSGLEVEKVEKHETIKGAGYGALTGGGVAGAIIFTGALAGSKRMPKNEGSLMGVGTVAGAIGGAGAGYMLSDADAPEAKALEQEEVASDNQ